MADCLFFRSAAPVAAGAVNLCFGAPDADPRQLLFADSRTPATAGAVDLLFASGDAGASPDGAVTPCALALDLPPFAADLQLALGFPLSLALTLPPLAVALQNRWDSHCYRPLVSRACTEFAAAVPLSALSASRWEIASPVQLRRTDRHAPGVRRGQSVCVNYQDRPPRHAITGGRWQAAAPRRASADIDWQAGVAHLAAIAGGWQDGIRAGVVVALRWQSALDWGVLRAGRYQQARAVALPTTALSGPAQPRVGGPCVRWQAAVRARPGRTRLPVLPGLPPARCYVPPPAGAVNLCFVAAAGASPCLLFVCRGSGPALPAASVVVLVREVYVNTHEVRLLLAESGEALIPFDLSLGIDADSWAWQFSARCALSEAVIADFPQAVIAQINGAEWRFWLESVSRARQFASDRWQLSGRGLAAMLDAPYAAAQTLDNAQGAMTAQQLANAALTINGVNNGWSLDWQLADWLVPQGVWHHQGSPVEAVNRLASAAGGYVQADRAEKCLHVLPRYPVAPWHWAQQSPAVELPSAVVVQESVDWVNKPHYDRVFVSGEEGGVLANVKRAGTAGASLAPMVVDRLVTAESVARQRGMAILADTGRQRQVALRLPVLAETGVIDPGRLLRYRDGDSVTVGLSRAVAVSYQGGTLRQTVTLEALP